MTNMKEGDEKRSEKIRREKWEEEGLKTLLNKKGREKREKK